MQNIKLFYGDEDFLIDEELRSVRSGYSDFNYERIDGQRAKAERIVSALTSLPMLGGSRLVEVDDLEIKPEEEEKIFGALKGLGEGIKAVFVFYSGIDKRRKFYKFMEKIADVREFKKLSEWEQDKALAWIMNRVRHYGKKIGGNAANLLIEIVGMNLRMLDKEIEKISTYVGDKEMIESRDVSSVASSSEVSAFSLTNALRDKNVAEAEENLSRLLKDNQDPHMLIGMIAKQYRMLLQVKSLEDKGMGQYEIARELSAKPFFVKKCMEKTGSFTSRELSEIIKMLSGADLKMKSGSSPRLTLELLIPELCNG